MGLHTFLGNTTNFLFPRIFFFLFLPLRSFFYSSKVFLVSLWSLLMSLYRKHTTETSASARIESSIPTSEHPQAYSLDRAATRIVSGIRSPEGPARNKSLYLYAIPDPAVPCNRAKHNLHCCSNCVLESRNKSFVRLACVCVCLCVRVKLRTLILHLSQ